MVLRQVVACCCCVYLYVALMILWFGEVKHIRTQDTLHGVNSQPDLLTGHRKLAEIQPATNGGESSENSVEKTFYDMCKIEEAGYFCPNSCYGLNSTSIPVLDEKSSNAVCKLSALSLNCEALKAAHGYDSFPVLSEEKSFPLAFAIKLQYKVEQAEQIFRTIYRTHNVYCFHVDRKSGNETFDTIRNIAKCFDNVVVIGDRETMVSASFAHVAADLKCMRALRNVPTRWKYYINLSDREFPLRTNLEMVRVLKFFKGLNDIETYDLPIFHTWRVENSFNVVQNSIAQVAPKSPFKFKLKMSMGNQYGLFSRHFVDFVLNDNVAGEIISWLKDTFSPQESVWATLVTLPWAPGSYPVTVRHMINTYVSRTMIVSGDTAKCHGRYIRGQCSFSCGDIPWITSRREFVASNFDYDKDIATLNCLEKWYRDEAYRTDTDNIDWHYYNKLPHLKYHRSVKHVYKSSRQLLDIKAKWLKEHEA